MSRFFTCFMLIFFLTMQFSLNKAFSVESGCQREVSRNPFLRPGEEGLSPGISTALKEVEVPLRLEATILSDSKEKMALINGQILREGEIIEAREVVTIGKNRVVLKDKGRLIILELPGLLE